MNDKLIILKFNRQKIPSNIGNLVRNEPINSSIPRKTNFSGHFSLKTTKITEKSIANQLIF
jgi:hypothetical protein